MGNKVIKGLMMGFSQEQLKSYLDNDILESLLEWNSDCVYKNKIDRNDSYNKRSINTVKRKEF